MSQVAMQPNINPEEAPPPSGLWRMLTLRSIQQKKLPKGLDAAYDRLVGMFVPLVPRQSRFMRRAKRVVAMQSKYEQISDARLKSALDDMRVVFRRGRNKRADIDKAFALVREAAWRATGMRPYLVQVAAGMAIEAGSIAEMATGEGKTLMATLPAVINGWRGRGCHVITVNDYLAKRDAEEMMPIYKYCGLTVSHVTGDLCPADRRAAYNCDVTYTTNKEVAADFLRDRLALGRLRGLPAALLSKIALGVGQGTDRLVMRGLECAIIDEADSVLIDEAVTPLIISGDSPNAERTEAYVEAAAVARELENGRDYKVNYRYREVTLTKEGRNQSEMMTEELGGIWLGARRREELVTQALSAKELFQRDSQYVVDEEEGKVVIIDESTGRLMPDRTWRDGLHQAVEAKEQIEVNPMKATFARVSFQRFFRLYRKLSGMTGTAWESKGEMWQIYKMPTVLIPTNRKCIRKQRRSRIFANTDARWRAVVAEIKKVHESGRPILVGTRSVDASERLSTMLTELNLPHEVLNAVRHEEEARIVADAGHPGKITVATNMAGRGTDIKLGNKVADLGGLAVIAAERNDSGRIDRQLYGRAGRQGDPGSAIAFVSLDDELILRYTRRWQKGFLRRLSLKGGELAGPIARRLVTGAQKRANKMALRQRKSVLKSDDWLDEFLGFAGRED